MKLPLAFVTLMAAFLAAGASPVLAATNECRGLMVCVPVAGPWVVVPTGRAVPRPRVEYQLRCPRGYIVGGLDAELSDRAIDVSFVATLGSPVNPGISTSRAAVFVATYVGASARFLTFRPHIGCMPTSGAGGRLPTSLSAPSVFPPGRPTVRRVQTVRVLPGRRLLSQGCAPGERLIAASHALGFYQAAPPTARLGASVVASQAVRGGRVRVAVRGGAALRRVRAVVQVGAVCAGGQ